MIQRQHEFDHRLSGVFVVVGALAVGVAATLTWLQADFGSLSFGAKLVFDFPLRHEIGGLTDGGSGVLGTDGVVLLLGLLIIATRRSRALISRTLLATLGMVAAGFGAFLIALPVPAYAAVLNVDPDIVQKAVDFPLSPLSIGPAIGAYLLATGGALIVIGAITPWSRRPLPPHAAA